MPAAPRIDITEIQRNILFSANFAQRDAYKNSHFVISLPTQGNRLLTDGHKIIMSSSRRGMYTQLKNDLQVALIPGPPSNAGPQNITWFNRNNQTASAYHSNETLRSDRVIGIAIKINDTWLEFLFTDGPIFFQNILPEIYPSGYPYQAAEHTTYRNNVRSNRQRVNKVSTLCRKAADAIIEQLEALGVIRIQTYLNYVSGVISEQDIEIDNSEDDGQDEVNVGD